jgi:V/A-type H+-transporting ATPase subunit E
MSTGLDQKGKVVVSMGLEKVIERIEKEGEDKITGILQDAEKQAALLLQNAQQRIDELSVKQRQDAEKHMSALKMQERSSIEIEAKKVRLNMEKEILHTTYEDCLTALQSLPHEKILSSLLKRVREELPDAAYLYSSKRDETLIRSLSKIPYDDSIECIGGIVVENTDKTLKLDYRYETIAETVWDHSLKEIAEKLFR